MRHVGARSGHLGQAPPGRARPVCAVATRDPWPCRFRRQRCAGGGSIVPELVPLWAWTARRARMPDNGGVTRLDQLLCERGLAETRSRAQALVMAGRVRVDGRLVTKAGRRSPRMPRSRSTRGRRTCRAAETSWPPRSRRSRSTCPGSSASTSVPRRAASPIASCSAGRRTSTALDVGRGQLHERLRADDRVTLLEGVNARLLAPGELPGPPATLAVVDVSFISLSLVLPPLVGVLAHPYRVLPLVKPQFEAGRSEVRRGVVRDPAIHTAVLERVAEVAARGRRRRARRVRERPSRPCRQPRVLPPHRLERPPRGRRRPRATRFRCCAMPSPERVTVRRVPS